MPLWWEESRIVRIRIDRGLTMKLPKLNSMEFGALLESLDACDDARKWAAGKSLAVALRYCRRADWMLWLLGQMVNKPGWMTHPQLVTLTCDCVEPSLRHVPPGEDRPRLAIEAARRWVADPSAANRSAARDAARATWEAARAAARAARAAAGDAAGDAEHRMMCKMIRRYVVSHSR
jgi:hypothetical protein